MDQTVVGVDHLVRTMGETVADDTIVDTKKIMIYTIVVEEDTPKGVFFSIGEKAMMSFFLPCFFFEKCYILRIVLFFLFLCLVCLPGFVWLVFVFWVQ